MYTGSDPNIKCNKSLNEATFLCIFMLECCKRLDLTAACAANGVAHTHSQVATAVYNIDRRDCGWHC